MVVLLLIGLCLVAMSVSLILRAAGAGRARAANNIGQISAYGYTTGQSTQHGDRRLRHLVDDAANLVGALVGGRLSRMDEDALKNMLMAAGVYSVTPRRFTGYRVLAAGATALTWLWVSVTGGYAAALVVIGGLIGALIGWTAPLSVLRRRAQRRLDQIDYTLPELIDLLVVTVEAGLGFNASLQVASERLEGPLGEELRLALQEQSMGLSTREALQHLLDRAETPSIRSFVRSMLQGETLGVSIGKIMRDLAVEMRKRRRAAAEERAQKAPIKILFPLIFLIFPAMFVILLGPAIFSFIKAIGG
jgi:tight adherence protein C